MGSHLNPGSVGLDFGCGPGPTVCVLMAERGHTVTNFDPIYHPDVDWRDASYDFITSTEVLEHLQHPRRELDALWSTLRPTGYLGIMTKRVRSLTDFKTWHYKNDPTHITFYSDTTFQWLAALWCAELQLVSHDVVILKKPAN